MGKGTVNARRASLRRTYAYVRPFTQSFARLPLNEDNKTTGQTL